MHAGLLLLMLVGQPGRLGAGLEAAPREHAAAETDPLFFDRLHQTFLLLIETVLPAYEEHFREEPENLATVRQYANRLTELVGSGSPSRAGFSQGPEAAGAAPDEAPDTLMKNAIEAIRDGKPDLLENYLARLGSQPHAVLQRQGETAGLATARCPLYAPELLWAHRRLWELKTGRPVQPEPASVLDKLAARQAEIRQLRELPEEAELSLRKFIDKHRPLIRELGWLFRCLGVQQERAGDPVRAREMAMRAWAIGEAQFPASERGRLDRFDPVFLAELGDVYARIGRFDLMLRYMYSEQGLPAQFAMARPVADMARAAEAVRLARRDESAQEQLDEVLPETVSQILFEQPVLPSGPATAASGGPGRSSRLGWTFIAAGVVILIGALVWRVRRASRRPTAAAQNPAALSTME